MPTPFVADCPGPGDRDSGIARHLAAGGVLCLICGVTYKTASGCSQHARQRDPDEYNTAKTTTIIASKRGAGRWTVEEDSFLQASLAANPDRSLKDLARRLASAS